MLLIEPLPMLQLCLILCGPTILDVSPYIEIGIDMLMDVILGLIHLFIGVTVVAMASQGAQRVPVLA